MSEYENNLSDATNKSATKMKELWITDNWISRKKKTFAQIVTDGNKDVENRSIQNIVKKKIELTTEFLPDKCLSDRKKSLSFSDIYKNLLEGEQTNSSRVPLSPPKICTDTSTLGNATSSSCRSNASEDISFNTQDNEILGILEELQCSANVSVNNLFCENNVSSGTEQSRLSGYFASKLIWVERFFQTLK